MLIVPVAETGVNALAVEDAPYWTEIETETGTEDNAVTEFDPLPSTPIVPEADTGVKPTLIMVADPALLIFMDAEAGTDVKAAAEGEPLLATPTVTETEMAEGALTEAFPP